MYKVLRIIFCILATAAAIVAVPVFIWYEIWGLVPVGVCIVCTVLMMVFKNLQEKEELRKNPPEPKGDFITGKVESKDDEGR